MTASINWPALSATASAVAAFFAAVAAWLARRDVKNQVRLTNLAALQELHALLMEAKTVEMVIGGVQETGRMWVVQDRIRAAMGRVREPLPECQAVVAFEVGPGWDRTVDGAAKRVQEEISKAPKPK